MLVSILVPIFGVEKYIERCAISLFSQSYDFIEFVFVNDCTNDRSLEILEGVINKFPNRKKQIKIIHHDKNKGLAATRKTALSNASGDYILHVDSDDYLEIDAVKSLCNIAKMKSADIVAFDINHIYKNKNVIEHVNIGCNKYDYIDNLLNRKTPVNLVCQFVRKDIIAYDALPCEGLNFGEDYVTTPRVAYYAKIIAKLNKPLYNYWHCNEMSYTNNISRDRLDDVVKASQILYDFFNSKSDCYKYTDMLASSDVRNKVLLLVLCNDKDLEYVQSLFLCANYRMSTLSFKHNILYLLSKYNMLNLLKIYKHIGLFIMKFVSF